MATTTVTHKCPHCEGPMVLRKSTWGEFLGCASYPKCKGTRKPDGRDTSRAPAENVQYEPLKILPGSDEQEAIWDYALEGRGHLVINAGPGSGKTWTSVQYCLRAPKDLDILFVAFNKHIAVEANGKLSASKCWNVKASTYHSLGYRILREHFQTLGNPDEYKMRKILELLTPMPTDRSRGEWRMLLNMAEKLCSYTKNYLIDYKAPGFRDRIDKIADHHGLEMNGNFQNAVSLIAPALDECKARASITVDFDDMIWLPVVLDLSIQKQPNVIISDEAQDLAAGQHEMMLRICGHGRALVVGDCHQAIYEWRSAVSQSMQIIRNKLAATKRGVREFPLTITRRCPKSHVRLAYNLFPCISALDDAPEGEILEMSTQKAVTEMQPGDLVICRINKELIRCAYALIRRGIRPAIKGRDIGRGLLTLIDTLDKALDKYRGEGEMSRMHTALRAWQTAQETKLLPFGDKAKGRIQAIQDKAACLTEMMMNSNTIEGMREKIDTLFSDEMGSKTVVVLGTVHRTKGLEAERVFVLAPDMIPHPMAKQEWEREGEKNIAWIAATRAKFTTTTPGTLVFCGHVPAIFKSKKAAAVRAEPEAESASLAKEEEAADGHVVGELTDENATRVQKAPLVPMTESVDEDEPPF